MFTFSWDENAADDTWVTPHRYGDSLSSTSLATYVGLGVFEGFIQNSQLRSINTSSLPTTSTTQNNFYNAAVYNRNWQYNNQLPMTYAWYVMQLYFVKGNRNVQEAYGKGVYGLSDVTAINQNWSATNAWNRGGTDKNISVTALGIQHAWGNVNKVMGETRYDNEFYRFTILGGKDHNNIESGYAPTWKSVDVPNTLGGYSSMVLITQINGTPEYPFFPIAGSTSGSTNYYADRVRQHTTTNNSVRLGGSAIQGDTYKGALEIDSGYSTSSTSSAVGARLHVLII